MICPCCGKHKRPTNLDALGTALKPAMELIAVARKPLSEKTVAANVIEHGTGAINIDGCRVAGEPVTIGMSLAHRGGKYAAGEGGRGTSESRVDTSGRWPANIIHDGSDEVMAAFPETTSGTFSGHRNKPKTNGVYGSFALQDEAGHVGDSGSAARFFYTARPDPKICDEVVITWISEQEPHQVTLRADTGQSLARATVVSASGDGNGWSTFLSGNTLTDLFRMVSTCTIRTKTNSIMTSRIWSYLIRLLTKESTVDVSYETESGGSHAEIAGSEVGCLIFTLAKTAYLPGANRAASGTLLKISVSARPFAQLPNEARRFWYTSKAGSDDRLGSSHPTVKPVDLMQWLVRLVTPKGGLVLDPFAGTGTTAEACYREGMRCMLVERETEYQADIRRRMALVLGGPEERRRESIKAKTKDQPIDHGPLFSLGLDSQAS